MTPPANTRWGIVWMAVIAGVIAAAHVGKLPPALPAIRADLGLGLVAGGWIVSVFSVTGMAAGVLAGTAADRVGPWRLVVVGLACQTIGSVGGGLAAGESLLLAARFLEGLGFIAVAVGAPSVIAAAAAPRDRRLALGLWGTYMPAGMGLMMVASPLALGAVGWRGLWGIVAALSAAWLAAMLAARRAAPAHHRHRGSTDTVLGNLAVTLSGWGPWLLAACFALYTIPWLALMVWLPSFMIEQRGLATGTAAALTALVVILNVPGNLTAGWFLHRGASHWALIAVAAVTIGAASMGIFSESLPDALRYALCLVFSGVGGMLPTAVLSGAPVFAPSPRQVGTTNGLLVQGSNTGQVIGPPMLAFVVEATGRWDSSVWLMTGACALCVAVALNLRPVEKRKRAALP